MLVEQDLKTHFPEMEEIKSAYEILNFVRRTKEVQKRYADAQNDLRMHQTKSNQFNPQPTQENLCWKSWSN